MFSISIHFIQSFYWKFYSFKKYFANSTKTKICQTEKAKIKGYNSTGFKIDNEQL